MSLLTTFNINDMVFIQNIGYGTLMSSTSLKVLPMKDQLTMIQKKQSIYFDPQLFSPESEFLTRKLSENSVAISALHNKLECKRSEQKNKTSNSHTVSQIQKNGDGRCSESEEKGKEDNNIVKVWLSGTQVLVYTPYKNIRKYITIPIRPLFVPQIGIIRIKIDINKTIQSLKREIFDFLCLNHAHFFNVKLFTTTPTLTELNYPGKTIWQSFINQTSTLTMTADHGFCFESIPPNLAPHFYLASNNLSFIASPRKPQTVAQNTVIALPNSQTSQKSTTNDGKSTPIKNSQNTLAVSPVLNQNEKLSNNKQEQPYKNQQIISNKKQSKIIQQVVQVQQPSKQNQNCLQKIQNIITTTEKEIKQEQKTNTKSNEQKKQDNKQEKQLKIPETLQIKGDKYVTSGRHYFQVRLDKLPTNPQHLKIGITTETGSQKWYFSPLTQQKIYLQNSQQISRQSYGISFKQNDVVGVLIKISRESIMKLNYYRNNANLGQCFKGRIQKILFCFQLGSEGQISLDTRVQPPLDSYRFR